MKKNKVIKSVDKLINKNKKLTAKMEKLQRRKDLILNVIDNFYTNRIDRVLREIEANEIQKLNGKEYTNMQFGGDDNE